MYSYEDRLRAVQLYIKLGKRAGLTIRQLGYPSKNALKVWHLAYEQSSDWTSHTTVDKLKPQIEARSNASGLTPPRWLWRRVRL